jgi:hypothetical protein
MKAKHVMGSLVVVLVASAMANDGVFYASGNGLVPKEETAIELRKEVLKLKRVGSDMEVSVDFTFFNPGAAKTELVGFVTPPADGDVTDKEKAHPQVSKFTEKVNGERPKHQVTRMKGSGFKTGPGRGMGDDFVYHFPVAFKSGENRVLHTYTYRGGSGVEVVHDFSYRLTTGKTWANGVIGDFTLEIDLGKGAYYAIPASFREDGRLAEWEAIGKSKLSKSMAGPFERKQRMFSQRDGGLRLKAKDFKPDYDLELAHYQAHMEMQFWVESPEQMPKYLQGIFPALLMPGAADDEQLRTQDGQTLRFVRNYYYARKGYAFKDPVVRRMFENFLWYDPQPGKEVVLSKDELAYITRIKKVEKGK